MLSHWPKSKKLRRFDPNQEELRLLEEKRVEKIEFYRHVLAICRWRRHIVRKGEAMAQRPQYAVVWVPGRRVDTKMPEDQARQNLSLRYVDAVNKHKSVNPKVVNAALASAGIESSRHARVNWEAYEAGLRDEGRAEGRAEGEEKGQADMLLAVLELRFGEVTEAQRACVLGAGSEQLKAWLPRALHADSVEAALGEG